MKILGIDPGIETTGYGILEIINNEISMLDVGVVRTSNKLFLSERFFKLYQGINSIIKTHKPDQVAIEELFFSINKKKASMVSQARGVIILSCTKKKLPVFSYTPSQIKKAITGFGKANKNQLTHMVKQILNLEETPKPDDAADALAIAFCHSNHYSMIKINSLYRDSIRI